MAYSKITMNKKGVLQAKIQAYGLDPATGKSKLYVKTIHNKDGLSEAKFRKYVAKAEIEFEESVKEDGKTSVTAQNDGVLTFSELMKEWKAHVLKYKSKSYYHKIEETEQKFTQFLIDNKLAYRPISDITVRHIQLYLNSFSTGEQRETPYVKLKHPLPKRVCHRELIREKVINACSLHNLFRAGGGVRKETAQKICDYCNIRFYEYFEPIYKTVDYSIETIKNHRRTLRTLFNEAVRYEWITKNPVCATKIGGSNANLSINKISEKEVFSIAELKEFLRLLDQLPPDMIHRRVTLKFLALTGVRSAELHGLRWSDIDIENKVVHIRRNRLFTQGFGVYEKETKTRTSNRDVPLTDELIKDLIEFKEWFRIADEDFDNKLDEYYFCSNIYRQPESISGTQQYLSKFEERHGLKHVSPHGLRHTYCSVLLAQNVPIQTVSKYMGHADSTVTLEVYSHFIPDTQEKVISALNNLLGD